MSARASSKKLRIPVARILAVALVAAAVVGPESHAEEVSPQEVSSGAIRPAIEPQFQPQICHAYDPRDGTFGQIGTQEPVPLTTSGYCPPNYAYYTVQQVSGDIRAPDQVAVAGACCPLPADDILTASHVFTTGECPPDHVATGAYSDSCRGKTTFTYADSYCVELMNKSEKRMRCTKINTAKYFLGPLTAGLGVSPVTQFSTAFKPRTSRAQVPAALRYAGGREGKNKWAMTFCIGYPWGSLLVAKRDKHCDTFSFRQLFYRTESLGKSVPGKPETGKAVPMFPECLTISDPYEPEPRCIPPRESQSDRAAD